MGKTDFTPQKTDMETETETETETVISLCDCLEGISKGKQIPGQQGTNYLWFIGCIQFISFIIWIKKSLEYVIFPEEVTVAINEMIDCNSTEKKECAN